MKKIYLYKTGLLLYGLGMVVLGIIFIVQGQFVLRVAELFGGAVLIAHGVHLLINFFFRSKTTRKITGVIAGLLNILGGSVILAVPNITNNLLIISFVVYVFLNALVKLIDYAIAKKHDVEGRFADFVSFLFFTVFGIITAFVPDMGMRSLLVVAGIYCILYGAGQLQDFIAQLIPAKTKNNFKRKLRIVTPVFISTFMPVRFLRYLNKFFQSGEERQETAGLVQSKEGAGPPDIEVLVHVSNDGVGKMGHCDLCFEGEVLSYGNYDFGTASFMRLYGDGVFFTAEKKRYIRFSVTHDKKTILCYGLRLTPEQREMVKNEIARLKANIYIWKPPFQQIKELDDDAVLDPQTDYCSKLWDGTRADFYKFHSGKFKKYFVLSTNCVLLADSILGKAGTDIVKLNGIITPGTYFDYMQREFVLPDGMVISRTIYNRKNTEDFRITKEGTLQWERI